MLKQLEINAKENANNWMKYTETEQDKRIYMPNNGRPIAGEVEKKEALLPNEISEVENNPSGSEGKPLSDSVDSGNAKATAAPVTSTVIKTSKL